MAFEVGMWLAVVDSAPDEAEARAFWNNKENSVLDAVADGDRFWIGETRADEVLSPGAAGQVHDLMFLLGTLPEYQLIAITEETIEQIVEAFDGGDDDSLPSASRADLIAFLQARRGRFLATDCRSIAS